jgi:signal transduction histidine kinase
VEIQVSDRGSGVSSNLEAAIFHPFFTTKQHGLGVGLAISRSIVEAHGGQLSYERRDGGGSTFVVTLPILT